MSDRDAEVAGLLSTIDQLAKAVETRTTIGKALGIIMERLDLGGDEAWAYLRRCSQNQNRRLSELAAAVVQTRELPDAASTRGA
jgi:AmiR/NasT family two-component response regulator